MIELPSRLLKHSTATPWGHSKWETLERCPKAFQLTYLSGIYLKGSTNRGASLGTVIHRGLAAYYWTKKLGAKDDDQIEKAWRGAIDWGREGPEIRLEGVRIVKSHLDYWEGGWRDPIFDEVIDVEKLVKTRIGNAPFTTQIDLVSKRKKTYLTIVDHKSTSRNSGDPTTEFSNSGQLIGMLASAKEWIGKRARPNEVYINQLIKTKVPDFRRFAVSFTEAQIDGWKRDLQLLNKDLERYTKKGYFPRHYSGCMTRYGPCQFVALCAGGAGRALEYEVPKGVDLHEAIR